eukprot:2960731-Alexandrium_andersonii.AAC.1
MAKSKNKLVLNQKTDRFLLLCLYEQSQQMCQLRIDKFEALGEKQTRLPNDHPAVLKAMRIMQPIAENYQNGIIGQGDKKGLYEARDLALSKLDTKKRTRQKSKKDTHGI